VDLRFPGFGECAGTKLVGECQESGAERDPSAPLRFSGTRPTTAAAAGFVVAWREGMVVAHGSKFGYHEKADAPCAQTASPEVGLAAGEECLAMLSHRPVLFVVTFHSERL
jgi:hypothetical protein